MALYKYVKKENRKSILSRIPNVRNEKNKIPKKFLILFSVGFFAFGTFLLGQVVYPLAGWYLFVLPGYATTINSPLSSSFRNKSRVLSDSGIENVTGASDNLSNENSYNANSWFVGSDSSSTNLGESGIKIYNISIPKLKIDSAIVEVGSDDLKKSLIGWPTSPLPGQYGNNIIFGHSELPQFASPTNYSGIFTHLMELGVGDEILVDYDGVRYKYEVMDKSVVKPTDLSVLEQRFDSAYITLITCVPPGTTWQRGVIRGRMVEI